MLTQDLIEGSLWQVGPAFLSSPYESWPVTTDEARYTARLPPEEIRNGSRGNLGTETVLTTVQESPMSLISVFYKSVTEGDVLGERVATMARESLTREKLEVSVRAMARVLRAVVCGDRSQCTKSPSSRFLELSVQMMLRASSASAREALRQGRLQSLGAVSRGGVVWVQGRVRGEELARLLAPLSCR